MGQGGRGGSTRGIVVKVEDGEHLVGYVHVYLFYT